MARPTRSRSEVEAAQRAIEAMGGATQATRLIREEVSRMGYAERGIARITVQKWKTGGVPYAWVSMIARLSGVPRWELSRLEPGPLAESRAA
jgi:hypothetical protein